MSPRRAGLFAKSEFHRDESESYVAIQSETLFFRAAVRSRGRKYISVCRIVFRCAGAGPAVTINSSVALVESAQASGPVKHATQDLRHDFAAVFGTQPRLVNSLSEAGPVAILIAQRDHVPAGVSCATTTNREAFAFSLAEAGGARKQRVVCLTGADMRGTIYAIYQFSQQYLGVDPMYLWTGKQPEKRSSLTLPADFTHTFPSPVFRYRGFFINDEDLLTGWRPPAKGVQSGISLKTWDMVFETILRLKGNMVVPGTWIFPDDAQVHAAAVRGLIINQHHAIPLGVNVARWPKGVPYNFSTHPEILERAWKDAVAEYKPGDDILWSVGLRGLSDQSYSAVDPSVRNNDPLLGKRISEAIADQMKIVRARYPHAQFVTDLWQEGARLMQEGYLKIPPGVTKVWADTGYGDMQDGGDLAAGEGMYIHTAMMNGNANQLTEMVPVSVLRGGNWPLHQGGRNRIFSCEHKRYSPGGDDDASGNGYGVGWQAARPLPTPTAPITGSGRRRNSAPSQRRRWKKSLQGVFCGSGASQKVSRPAAVDFGGERTTAAAYSNVRAGSATKHYHTEARRLILEEFSGAPGGCTSPASHRNGRRPGLLPDPGSGQVQPELANDIQDVRNRPAALGYGVARCSGCGAAGGSQPAPILPGRSAHDDHHQPRKQPHAAGGGTVHSG